MPRLATQSPLRLATRCAIVAAAVLWGGQLIERPLAQWLAPAIRGVTAFFGDDFTFLDIEVVRDGERDSLRVRANLSHPLNVGGHVVYPYGWRSQPDGWSQVNLTLKGLFQYAAMLLIVVFAWPAAHALELLRRAALTVPLIVLLLLVQIPPTILAELWFPLHADFDAHSFWPLLAWSRFLMGGGGLAVALLLATVAIGVGKDSNRIVGDESHALA